jgi:ABC-2 type transport system permease protein
LIKDNTPNINSLLNTYGVAVKKAIVVEGDQKNIYNTRNPLFLIPRMNNEIIMKSLISEKLNVLIPVAQPIDILKLKRQTLDIIPLLTTTDKAWGKINIETNSLYKENRDLSGPFNVAVALGDGKNLDDLSKNAKMVIVGSSLFLDSQIISDSNDANLDFFMNCLGWLQDKQQNLYIRPKNLLASNLNINGYQQLFYSCIVIIAFPLIIFILGVIIWMRRRNL